MSNHFTGLSLGPPLGDQRLDLCDLYAFQSPADPDRTVLILNANPTLTRCTPTPSTGSTSTTTATCVTTSRSASSTPNPQDGRQTVDVYLA